MKKSKEIFPKSAIDSVSKLNKAAERFAEAIGNTNRNAKYFIWALNFKPQSQRAINITTITILVLAIAEIVWFWLTKY